MRYKARELRIVNNNSRDYQGGYTVEYGDVIIAGPYPAKEDAKTAKRCLVAGEPLPAYLDDITYHDKT